MKKKLFFLFALLTWAGVSHAYDFSSVCSTGQTLYYNISGTSAIVTYPGLSEQSPYNGYTQPTGDLSIPAWVSFQGISYKVDTIGNYAFRNCVGLTSISFSDSLHYIGRESFYGCNGISTLTIPHSIVYIGWNAFSYCSNLTTVYFNADTINTHHHAYLGGTWINYTREVAMFYHCENLTTVVFGDNVKVIPTLMCYGCSNLQTINIPESVVIIGTDAFRECSNLYRLSSHVNFPEGLSVIGNDAFKDCTNLFGDTVTLPSTLIYFGKWSFLNCTGITTIIFNADSTYDGYPFWNAEDDDLSSWSYTGYPPFAGCNNVTSIQFGSSVRHVVHDAFRGCNFSEITFHGITPPVFGYDAFANTSSDAIIYVPCGTIPAYSAALPQFNNFVEHSFSFIARSENENKGTVSISNEPTCENPTTTIIANALGGYQFDHWSDGSTENPRTLTVTNDTELVAYFVSVITQQTYCITAYADDPATGHVEMTVTLTAVPENGYQFSHWQDGNTENPRTITVTEDTTMVAYFVALTGVDGAAIPQTNIYVSDGCIRVDGALGRTVCLYDVTGRLLLVDRQGKGVYPVPATGIYLLQLDNHPAKRIAVVR